MDELLSRAVVVYLGGDPALFRRARDRPSLNYSVLVAEVGEQKAEEVREQTDQLIAEALAVEVDWYEHGLVAAIALVEAEFDCVLCAVALTSCVAKVFDVTALDTIIPTYQGVAEACEKQLQLNQTPVQHAPVPIETFLMRRVPADAETPVDSTMNA